MLEAKCGYAGGVHMALHERVRVPWYPVPGEATERGRHIRRLGQERLDLRNTKISPYARVAF